MISPCTHEDPHRSLLVIRLVVSDSQHYQQAMVATQLNEKILSEEVQKLGLIKLTEVICNVVQNRR